MLRAHNVLSMILILATASPDAFGASSDRRTTAGFCYQCSVQAQRSTINKLPTEFSARRRGRVRHGRARNPSCPRGFGVASFYGGQFIGRRTASGDRYTGRRLTLAHMSLPIGTKLLLTTPSGHSVPAVVTDRGNFAKYGRSYDLSPALKRALRIQGGLGCVKHQIIGRNASTAS